MKTLSVSTPGGAYEVRVGAGALDDLHLPASAEHVALVVDERLLKDRAVGELKARLEHVVVHSVPSGEKSKSIDEAARLWDSLALHGFHRSDVVVAVGGGVTTDLAGFVAATYHRGIRWFAVPTTLLGMVDASIGGKTAIDLSEGKNLVGAFHQPGGVIADVTFLRTLPHEAFATGVAEIVKHGLIEDLSLLDRLDRDREAIEARDANALEDLVHQAAAVKVRIVNEDETEHGARAFLNYGHTLGHALETLGGYERVTHGQAIAIGMMYASHLAVALGYADRVSEHHDSLASHALPVAGAGWAFDDVLTLFKRDKKYEAGMRFVLLEDLGKPILVRDVPVDALRAAYEKVR